MQHSELIASLQKMEQQFPVESWKTDNIDLWPIVKFEIFKQWRVQSPQQSPASVTSKTNSNKAAAKKNSLKKITALLISSLRCLQLLIKPVYKKLLLVGSCYHRITYNGIFINRYYEPFLNSSLQNDCLSLDYGDKLVTQSYPKSTLMFTRDYEHFFKLFTKKVRFKLLTSFGDEAAFRAFFESDLGCIDLKKLERSVESHLNKVRLHIRVYRFLLKKIKPAVAVQLCYYSPENHALNWVARERNILTVDLQHGSLGNTHLAYSGFSKMPVNGFNVFPKIFWCWDKQSAEHIRTWANRTSIQVFVTGNPWILYQQEQKGYIATQESKKIILYTLQNELPSKQIINAINNTPSEKEWWLRLHPRFMHHKDVIVDVLSKHNVLHKVNIEDANKQTLYDILVNTFVNITMSSGSVIEAAHLGVRSIVLDPIGYSYYTSLIEEGIVTYWEKDSKGDLLSTIFHVGGDERCSPHQIEINCHNFLEEIVQGKTYNKLHLLKNIGF